MCHMKLRVIQGNYIMHTKTILQTEMTFQVLIKCSLKSCMYNILMIHNNYHFQSIKPANYLKSSLDFEKIYHNEKIGFKVDSTCHTISNNHNVYHILQSNTKINKHKHANITNLVWTHDKVFQNHTCTFCLHAQPILNRLLQFLTLISTLITTKLLTKKKSINRNQKLWRNILETIINMHVMIRKNKFRCLKR